MDELYVAAADRADAVHPAASGGRLVELREEINRLRTVLASLPTRLLTRFGQLEAAERELTARRDGHLNRLTELESPARRLGRVRDAHADERSFLRSALEVDDRELSELRGDRARLQRELGDPDQVRSERAGIELAIDRLQSAHDEVRDVLADRLIERRPDWLVDTLGEPPQPRRERDTWHKAARSIAAFRLDRDVADDGTPLGPKPPVGARDRHAWDRAQTLVERAQRQLGRQPPARDRGPDLGIG